ncbi:PilZ domain-containing protein [Sphingosinicella rhizophila]|uniref:PilZ domain-containing protein n=1 Tax=Sphingosinicella rhizophila TaxID=3050082 RepID=A0ABU3Q7H5_9SPHN|nr:PilZ domain-containing protein [Sphingosinicella sp. GR2756]MDT9599354.1 PilZ domain-containing protein [Sphingosinicella sp. GR2756]
MAAQQMSLARVPIHRSSARNVDQRSEPRYADLVDNAVLFLRGERHPVRVINISSRGTMIETDLMPRLGESVLIQFEACSRIHAFVRWIRDGRIGLNFGHEIVLG